MSATSAGVLANGNCKLPAVSHDGRFVAFSSFATNLVPGDTNYADDVFILDRSTGTLERVSITSAGVQANSHCAAKGISADGRMVAFGSVATNLDPRDTDPVPDVYVHDRKTRITTLVSERLGAGPSVNGCFEVSISADGRFVAFDSLDGNVLPGIPPYNVYVRDLTAQTTECISVGPAGQVADHGSYQCSISGDGRFVAFASAATNWYPIVPGNQGGVFVRDRLLGVTVPVTMLPNGVLAPGVSREASISADGRYVAFSTNSRFLVPGQPFFADVLRWDRLTGKIVNVCVPTTGGEPSYPSYYPFLSSEGRFVAFQTLAVNLTVQRGEPPMVIWKDMETGATVICNEDPQGGPANDWANDGVISGDGRVVAFVSKATDLVPGASGNVYHVYVRACEVASPSTYCKPAKPASGCIASMTFQGAPSASAGSGFLLQANSLDAKKVGLLFYGTNGPWGSQLPDGFLCVKAPIVRPYVASSGGTSACTGHLTMDFNAWIATGGDPTLVAGQDVCAQAWFRNSNGAGQLSDAVAFLIGQ